MSAKRKKANKGAEAEEALRNYFLATGYYVLRGVRVAIGQVEVTDVDLWLYLRSTSLSRERTNVDVKRKTTPKAMERVFWTKGLQIGLGLERCVVATTDKRRETREFGDRSGVRVLDGHFLNSALKRYAISEGRLTEEQFLTCLEVPSCLDRKVELKRLYEDSKRLLLMDLSYNGCNTLLSRIHFAMQESHASAADSSAAIRLVLALTSHFLVALDFVAQRLAQMDGDARKREMAEGFRYGEAGEKKAKQILDMALKIVPMAGGVASVNSDVLKQEIARQYSSFPAENLADFFGRNDVFRELFDMAREFEAAACTNPLPLPGMLPSRLKSVLGALADFHGIDRKGIL